MSERIRRVKKDRSSFPKKCLGIFLVIAACVAAWLLWGVLNKKGNLPETKSKKIVDSNPVAVLCRENNDCYWLNQMGIAFEHSGYLSGNLILIITDKTSREFKLGQELLKPETLGELIFLRENIIDKTGMSLQFGETQDPALQDFDFITSQGWLLRLSIAGNAYKTIEVLKQTLDEIGKTKATSTLDYIDLRISNKVYYKFR